MSEIKMQLTTLEISRAARFVQKHGKVCKKMQTESLEFKFTPTGIGTGVDIICPCGAKKNITDYDSW